MPRTASQRRAAEPVRAARPARPSRSRQRQEALRLAETAAAFGLFGLQIQPDAPAADAASAYRVASPPPAPPANDPLPAGPAFPEFARRMACLPRSLPVRLMQLLDWAAVAAAAELAARWGAGASLTQLPIGSALAFLLAAGALKAGLWLTGAYHFAPARFRAEQGIGGLALGAVLGVFLASALAPDARSVAALAATLPFTAMLLAGAHAALAHWTAVAVRRGAFSETIVIVGATDAARRLAMRLAKSDDTRVVAVFDDRVSRAPSRLAGAPVAGSLAELLDWEGLPYVDRVVVAVPARAEDRLRAILARLCVVPNRVELLLDPDVRTGTGDPLDQIALARISGEPRDHRRAFIKRGLDLALGALLALTFILPVLLAALLVRIASAGPAFVREPRRGLNNRVFTLWRLRTERRDGRTSRLGALLRRTRLDDAPQLLNVLRGEMSLVGPRPHPVDAAVGGRAFTAVAPDYAHRHRVKPGLMAWTHLNGAHGPVKSPSAARRRLRLDLDYVARCSFWFDLHILARLVTAAFKRGV